MLKKHLSELEVENVYIYVSDALRWDFIKDKISEKGILVKGVADSVHSPSSFCSISTGLHTRTHGVFTFGQRLSNNQSSLLNLEGIYTSFVNSIQGEPKKSDPIYSVLNIDKSHQTADFETIEEPFLMMERGPGGHAPYDSLTGSAEDYFDRIYNYSNDEIKSEYEKKVDIDAKYFEDRLSELSKNGFDNDTLVIFLSDHGELLGENGILGHNGIIHPKLSYVPVVFIHDDLPNQVDDSGVFRHIDLYPTLQGIIPEINGEIESDGRSVVNRGLADFGPTYYKQQINIHDNISFKNEYSSVWEPNGGYVFAQSPVWSRMLTLLGMATTGSKNRYIRRHLPNSAKNFFVGTKEYGNPKMSLEEAEKFDREFSTQGSASSYEISDESLSQLEKLGYR